MPSTDKILVVPKRMKLTATAKTVPAMTVSIVSWVGVWSLWQHRLTRTELPDAYWRVPKSDGFPNLFCLQYLEHTKTHLWVALTGLSLWSATIHLVTQHLFPTSAKSRATARSIRDPFAARRALQPRRRKTPARTPPACLGTASDFS